MTVYWDRFGPGEQWDENLVELLLTNRLYPTGLKLQQWSTRTGPAKDIKGAGGCILIVPGRYWHDRIAEVNEVLGPYRWVLVIVTSDEESLLNINDLKHPNMKVWLQTPRPDYIYDTFGIGSRVYIIPIGFPPHFNDLPADPPDKVMDVFLSGQNTHPRRNATFEALENCRVGIKYVKATEGFTQGLAPVDYVQCMLQTKVAPAPAGFRTADTFRAWEALECHAVPVLDNPHPRYWDTFFGDMPAPRYDIAACLPEITAGELGRWPWHANRVAAWWMRYKRSMAHRLVADLKELGAI